MDIAPNATKRGHDEDDIRHAAATPVLTDLQIVEDEARQLIVGPARDGTLLELVIANPFTDKATVVHCMDARDTFIARITPAEKKKGTT